MSKDFQKIVPSAPVVQKPIGPAPDPARAEAIRQATEQVKAELPDLRAEILSKQSQALDILITERAEQLLAEKESRERLERARALAQLTATERTQLVADEKWPAGPGTRRFAVTVDGDKVQPRIEINAHTEDEAIGAYARLCGILSLGVDSHYTAEAVTQAA